jgi:hypothetical protein
MKQPDHIFRIGFVSCAIILLVGMPLMSLDHGTTWDEIHSHKYGQHLLDFYASFGEDEEALDQGTRSLKGGLFEMLAEGAVEGLNPVFDRNYTYEIRHVVNALAGLLAMIFTGLLARYLGWVAMRSRCPAYDKPLPPLPWAFHE